VRLVWRGHRLLRVEILDELGSYLGGELDEGRCVRVVVMVVAEMGMQGLRGAD